MKLMTSEIQAQLIANDLKVIETGESPDAIVVKYFNPTGAGSWYIVSATPVDGEGEPCHDDLSKLADWHMFGYCDLSQGPYCAELGYVMLSDIESIKDICMLPAERDLAFEATPHSLKKVIADTEASW